MSTRPRQCYLAYIRLLSLAVLIFVVGSMPVLRAQTPVTEVSGPVVVDTLWTGPGEIHVLGTVTVESNASLTIHAGTRLKFAENVALMAETGSRLAVEGEQGNPVILEPLVPGTLWGSVGARGEGSHATLQYAQLKGGQCAGLNGATLLLTESLLEEYRPLTDFTLLSRPILVSEYADQVRVRRCTFRDYHEVLLRYSLAEVVDSLFEVVHGDGLDLDYAPEGCRIEDCTFRNGLGANIDALDVGSASQGVTIADCVMQGFPDDKGISIGEQSVAIVVRNCLINDVDTGVSVKDSSEASIAGCTIVNSTHGFRFYEKYLGQGGGAAETWNNIVWGNGSAVTLDSLSTISIDHSLVAGGYAGEGNVDRDPEFRNAAVGDYRLELGSALLEFGRDGLGLGVVFPVGSSLVDSDEDGLPDPWEQQYDLDPHDPADAATDRDGDHLSNLAEFRCGTDPLDSASVLRLKRVTLPGPQVTRLAFDALPGRSYAIEYRDSWVAGGPWLVLTNRSAQSEAVEMIVDDVTEGRPSQRFYHLRLTER